MMYSACLSLAVLAEVQLMDDVLNFGIIVPFGMECHPIRASAHMDAHYPALFWVIPSSNREAAAFRTLPASLAANT